MQQLNGQSETLKTQNKEGKTGICEMLVKGCVYS